MEDRRTPPERILMRRRARRNPDVMGGGAAMCGGDARSALIEWILIDKIEIEIRRSKPINYLASFSCSINRLAS